MSILASDNNGFIISHFRLIDEIVEHVVSHDTQCSFTANFSFFNINKPFKTFKHVSGIKLKTDTSNCENVIIPFKAMRSLILDHVKVTNYCYLQNVVDSPKALADSYCKNAALRKLKKIIGGNTSSSSIMANIEGEDYIIPENSKFYNCDVADMNDHLLDTFDCIVLDPPWWNKYIRRKRSHNADDAYNMMDHADLAKLPIKRLLHDDGLLVVWCTNAKSHEDALLQIIFPLWNVLHIATWHWLKVTTEGEPVTPFSSVSGKQPFERIFFAVRNAQRKWPVPSPEKLVVSVPSAIHSQKPPLLKLLEPFLRSAPKCLEVFARSLLPGWTSYGNEVLKLQHKSFFCEKDLLCPNLV